MAETWNDTERVAQLLERLGVELPDGATLLSALTHTSYLNEHPHTSARDYERLEFLGDAVLDLAVGHRLMERHPSADEGELSRLRALVVNEETLAGVARAVGLGELLLLGRGEELTGGRDKPSVLADALEAVLGGIYLAGGLDAALRVVDAHFAAALTGAALGKQGEDYKTRLQELVQSRRAAAPRYRVVAESGPAHARRFEVEVSIGEQVHARASGRSKKEAEQAAAKETLAQLSHLEPPPGTG